MDIRKMEKAAVAALEDIKAHDISVSMSASSPACTSA